MTDKTKELIIARINELDSFAFELKKSIDKRQLAIDSAKDNYNEVMADLNALKKDLEDSGLTQDQIFSSETGRLTSDDSSSAADIN